MSRKTGQMKLDIDSFSVSLRRLAVAAINNRGELLERGPLSSSSPFAPCLTV